MDSEQLTITALVVAGILLFVVAAAESAIIYISRSRARAYLKPGDRRGEALHAYIAERQRTVSALNLGRTLAVVGATAAALHLASEGGDLTWTRALVTAGITLAVVAVLDGIPDVVISRNPEFWGVLLTPFVRLLNLILAPLAWLLDRPGWLIARLPVLPDRPPAEEESETLLRLVEMEPSTDTNGDQSIQLDERRMIRGVMDLEETAAREIMVPRVDLVAVPNTATVEDAVRLVVEKGLSRVPLYEESVDNIKGVVYAKDLLRLYHSGLRHTALEKIARPAHFIPETKRLDDLLAELRAQKIHIAVVVDEYGGTAGIVTTEDIIEEIVGEIEDEYDTSEVRVEVHDNYALLDGRVSLYDMNELLDIEIESEDVDTIGGFVINQLGKVPAAGDDVRVDGIVIEVLSVQRHRVKQVRVTKLTPEPAATGGNGNGHGNSNGAVSAK